MVRYKQTDICDLAAETGGILHQAKAEKESLVALRGSRIEWRRAFLLVDWVGYTSREMYARKFTAEMTIGDERRPVPFEWLDSFCMRNFTGSAEFDDTLPIGEGRLEVGSKVDAARLAGAMSEWFTKRGKGGGAVVTVELREEK